MVDGIKNRMASTLDVFDKSDAEEHTGPLKNGRGLLGRLMSDEPSPDPDPSRIFLEQLQVKLQSLASAANWPKANYYIGKLEFDEDTPKRAYGYKNGPTLNPAHPLVAHCIANFDGGDDPAMTFAHSIAATAVNLWVEEIYDRHELTLLLKLLRELNPK
jgi:hypothetical protein